MKHAKPLLALLLCLLLLGALAAPAFAAELPSAALPSFLSGICTAFLRLLNYLRFALAVLPPPVL